MVQRWPALFTESQVYCEFNRVVGKNLKDNFLDALDRFSPSLMDLFRKKKGVTGKFLSELLRQTKTTEPTDIRCLCVRGLPIILGDEPSAFFKSCPEVYSQTPLGILCVGVNPQLNPSSVAIVLEGNVVMDGPANLPQAFCQVMLNLGKVELAPTIQTLKNQLTL
ncbi:NADPH--cytochrome P450 reductase [Dissostichus eleginoides]|uniref:NADPH--cytochrome P450 reductase n=1 Tax=Dissostichus eleginoides TaxID=100907 RepID=A0AAD9BLH9_DISEL|nr:NADPH--cytochrome P450 reductase [Dissostichus eleginoides]